MAARAAINERWTRDRQFAVGLARAFGGALIFAVPLLMTMELWWLGFLMEPWRLALFVALGFPLLVGLSYFAGFEETFTWADDLRDACVAYAVGVAASAALLLLFGVIGPGTPFAETVGKIAVQAVPASIGALLARDQFGQGGQENDEQGRRRHARYGGQLFLMLVGAAFLALNVAPTEEMVLIAHQSGRWHSVALALVSLALMHGIVYLVGFSGQEETPPGTSAWSLFLRFTVVGYALALLVSAYALWSFGRADGLDPAVFARVVVVLGFPAALGAAAARLIV